MHITLAPNCPKNGRWTPYHDLEGTRESEKKKHEF